jgi:hypothetical protein
MKLIVKIRNEYLMDNSTQLEREDKFLLEQYKNLLK